VRAFSWAIAAALVATTAVIAGTNATGASGSSVAWGQWRGTVRLDADLTWYSPGVPNGQGGLTSHTTMTIVWRLDQPAPPDPDGENDGLVAAGPATVSFAEADVGEPNYCDDIVRRTGSLEATWRDVLTLDGDRTSSDRWVDFTFEELGQAPNLEFPLATEYGCRPTDVSPALAFVPRRFRVTPGGWAGGVLIDRNSIVGRTTITCDDWMQNPPRTPAECDPPQLESGWMRSVYTITVALDRENPPSCIVPKVVGLKLARARTQIRARRCSLGHIRRVRSTKARAGRVVAQSPRSGTVRRNGFPVTLVVGRG